MLHSRSPCATIPGMPRRAPCPIAPQVYARVTGGTRQVWCPRCGCFNHRKIPPYEVVVRMQCTTCGLVFYWGSTLYLLNDSNATDMPPDCVTPLFADVQLAGRRKGEPVNRLRTLNLDGSWSEVE